MKCQTEQNFNTRCSIAYFFHPEKIVCLSIVTLEPFQMVANDCVDEDEALGNEFA